ncbi:uncharacterized protein MYCFIDRAFT_173834 [Pseudocercospora fijiensis CIRAD86]|uniref:Uncharacterized protein n=1 Tax=Pseudocercospora fijiensis (strain CIRAD86) TaxID=383855 RepID=M3B6H8_PSEFD|nr:uncharacterized protein MYCFIDRAFT_173834 [Pseudocercospora fijiensis CIRAD86]EME84943.1 hypothetical protein MYCFIDRAFT_173834 [Pseudocercospora fijiensis CIRAD86]
MLSIGMHDLLDQRSSFYREKFLPDGEMMPSKLEVLAEVTGLFMATDFHLILFCFSHYELRHLPKSSIVARSYEPVLFAPFQQDNNAYVLQATQLMMCPDTPWDRSVSGRSSRRFQRTSRKTYIGFLFLGVSTTEL